MKTITKAEYEALPVEKQRYWEPNWPINRFSCGKELPPHHYTPVTIYLEDSEGVIEDAISDIDRLIDNTADSINFGLLYTKGKNTGFRVSLLVIKNTLNKLKSLQP